MFSTPIRAILVVTALSVGAWQLSRGHSSALWLVAAAVLLAYGHFRYGSVWLAMRALRAGNVDRAGRLLAQVKHPATLSSQQRAYFELASGLLAARAGADIEAEQHFRSALDHRLRTENDRCIAEVELARLLAKRGERVAARELLARARSRQANPDVAEEARRVQELVNADA